ncbi:restriction endonuclease subunit S [Streptomyces sp. NPDC058985]|uniref:restriction endonuclease subunit S n=1 Tax=Streptomyces sp. NPDC058985 TaxID=3346684 RepID=UPI0036B45BB7
MVSVEHKPLGQLLLRPPRYGINAAAVPLAPGVATYIRITDIDDSGRFSPDPKVGVDHVSAANYRLATGELVFARTGASVGKSYLYDSRDGELVYAGFLINIAPDPKLLNPKYLSLFTQSKEYWDWVARTSVRSGQPGINGREYAQLPVPLPDIATQNAIAAAMNDVDNLLSTLERLIAKKQAIKQGAMQELLTGRTRLQGYRGVWEYRRVTEMGDVLAGKALNVSGAGALRPYLRTKNVLDGRIDLGDVLWMPMTDAEFERFGIERGDVLLNEGQSLELVGRCSMYNGEFGASCTMQNQLLRFRAHRGTSPEFAAHLFRHCQQTGVFAAIATKTTSVAHLGSSRLSNLRLLWPTDRLEQAAIAEVLSDMDTEITAHEARLDKLRALKQGMLQQLLTGRTRLPVKESAA